MLASEAETLQLIFYQIQQETVYYTVEVDPCKGTTQKKYS